MMRETVLKEAVLEYVFAKIREAEEKGIFRRFDLFGRSISTEVLFPPIRDWHDRLPGRYRRWMRNYVWRIVQECYPYRSVEGLAEELLEKKEVAVGA